MLNTKKSANLFSRAQKVLVGGVNSPVRAFKSVGGSPLFIEKASGAFVTDADGNKFADFVGSWGPMILGHSHPKVVRAVKAQAQKGTSFGAPSHLEIVLADLVAAALPSVEKVRFMSSGTEAVMTALRLARAVTKRDKIIKFSGCYHGHSDSLLVKAGSGAATLGIPDSAGVSASVSQDTVVLPYNNSLAVKTCLEDIGQSVAAIIVEPVAANMGLVYPEPGFLETLRELCTKYGAVLIFDEVITGFRSAWGGAQTRLGVMPDLTCLGKIIGGGLPVGAVGGKKEIMDLLAPLGPVYQAGTLSGNPLAMAAGIAALTELKSKKPYALLEKRTQKLIHSLRDGVSRLNLPVQIPQAGSLFTVFFTPKPARDFESAAVSDGQKYAKFFHTLLEEKIYFPPSQFEVCFVSLAHTDSLLEKCGKTILKSLERTFHA